MGARGTVAGGNAAEGVEEDDSVELDGLVDGGRGRLVGRVGGEQGGEGEHQGVGGRGHRALRLVVCNGDEDGDEAARERRDEEVREGDLGGGHVVGHGDAAVDAAGAAAAVLNCRDDTVGLGVQERAPGGDAGGGGGQRGRRRLVDNHDREEAEAVQLAEGAADAAQGRVVDVAHIADLDQADVDLLLDDLGNEEGGASGDGQLGQGGRWVVLEEPLHVGLVPGLDVGLGEGGLLEVFQDGGRARGGGGVWREGERGLEALQIGAGLARGRGGRQDGEVQLLGMLGLYMGGGYVKSCIWGESVYENMRGEGSVYGRGSMGVCIREGFVYEERGGPYMGGYTGGHMGPVYGNIRESHTASRTN